MFMDEKAQAAQQQQKHPRQVIQTEDRPSAGRTHMPKTAPLCLASVVAPTSTECDKLTT